MLKNGTNYSETFFNYDISMPCHSFKEKPLRAAMFTLSCVHVLC